MSIQNLLDEEISICVDVRGRVIFVLSKNSFVLFFYFWFHFEFLTYSNLFSKNRSENF